ncbi:hypothetical protein C7B80_08105 [Cyanosarcina cf. burmensis CCALA 770]|nr:hypothetical protein C7B80_08105 [Cyanosarcina cf. burmensis CCALA 770]
MKVEFRKLHRQLAPILFLPLLASALTGVAYRLGKSWFGVSTSVGDVLMTIHQGEYLGKRLVPIYIILISLGILGMSVTGTHLLDRRSSDRELAKSNIRNIHRLLALILLLPLSISAETGLAYTIARDWLGLSREQIGFLLEIHQGLYLGGTFSNFYILLLGSGLVVLLIAGIRMTSLIGSQIPRQQPQQSPVQTLSPSALADTVALLRRQAWLGLILFLTVFCSALYGITSRVVLKEYNVAVSNVSPSNFSAQDLLIPIGILGLVCGVLGAIVVEKLIQNWRRQKEVQSALYESETASSTILRALPDSILRMKQDGTCLSYMPAKEANSFTLNGDILGKNVNEFLPAETAQQLLEYARLALRTGATQIFQFSVSFKNKQHYQEARISTIGDKEFLIVFRDLANLEQHKVEQNQ